MPSQHKSKYPLVTEREKERERDRERQRERDRDRKTDRQTGRQTGRDRQTDRQRHSETQTDRQTQTHKYRDTDRDRDRDRDRQRQGQIVRRNEPAASHLITRVFTYAFETPSILPSQFTEKDFKKTENDVHNGVRVTVVFLYSS